VPLVHVRRAIRPNIRTAVPDPIGSEQDLILQQQQVQILQQQQVQPKGDHGIAAAQIVQKHPWLGLWRTRNKLPAMSGIAQMELSKPQIIVNHERGSIGGFHESAND
jgi:hypothetical protein